MKGGLLSCIDENNLMVSWVSELKILNAENSPACLRQRLCQTKNNAELEEMFRALRLRHTALHQDMPTMIIADNCCVIRGPVEQGFGAPAPHIGLDVYHLIGR